MITLLAIPKLKSVDAEHVADALVSMFSRVGVPKVILTDQETNCTSKLLAELYGLVHVKALKTSPYHPQTDGLVECFNHTLRRCSGRPLPVKAKTGTKRLPYVLFAHREVPQTTTGLSPI